MPVTETRFRQPKEILAMPEDDSVAVSSNGLIAANPTDWDHFFPKGLVLVESAGSYAPYIDTPVTIDDAADVWNESTSNCTVTSVYDSELLQTVNRFDVAAAATANAKVATEVVSCDLSSATTMGFWIKSDIALAAATYKIMTDDSGSCASPIANASPSLPALEANKWTFVTMAMSSGSASTISVGLQLLIDVGANTLWIGKIRAFATNASPAAGVLKDDVSFNALLNEDINTNGTSRLSCAVYTHGTFQKARLIGWDAGAATDLAAISSENASVVRF